MAQLKLVNPYVTEAHDQVFRFGYGLDPRRVEGFAVEPEGLLVPVRGAEVVRAADGSRKRLRTAEGEQRDYLSYGEGIAEFEKQEGCEELAVFENNGDYLVCLNVEARDGVRRYYLHPVAVFSRCPGALTEDRGEAARIATQAGAVTLLLRAHRMVRERFENASIHAFIAHHEDPKENPYSGLTYSSVPVATTAAYSLLPEQLRLVFEEHQNFSAAPPNVTPDGSVHISGLWLDGHQGLTLDGFARKGSQWIHRELGCVLRTSEGPGASFVPGPPPSQRVQTTSIAGGVVRLEPTPMERIFGRSLEIDFYPTRAASERAATRLEQTSEHELKLGTDH